MGTRDNKLEERGLPRDSCLLLSAPTGAMGAQINLDYKRPRNGLL